MGPAGQGWHNEQVLFQSSELQDGAGSSQAALHTHARAHTHMHTHAHTVEHEDLASQPQDPRSRSSFGGNASPKQLLVTGKLSQTELLVPRQLVLWGQVSAVETGSAVCDAFLQLQIIK